MLYEWYFLIILDRFALSNYQSKRMVTFQPNTLNFCLERCGIWIPTRNSLWDCSLSILGSSSLFNQLTSILGGMFLGMLVNIIHLTVSSVSFLCNGGNSKTSSIVCLIVSFIKSVKYSLMDYSMFWTISGEISSFSAAIFTIVGSFFH